jgi:Helix-hairpin-helix motif
MHDPAVAQVLAARARRKEARTLAAEDPLMARELHIGRPDLPRIFDDGGLVDLNSAPASVIARVCGLDEASAAMIIEARARFGDAFSTVDDVFAITDLPIGTWDLIRDRGITIPR